MKSAEMTETLIRAIQNYAEYYLAEHDESALYESLSTLFNLSDADIDAIGLGRLIPEPNEPDEEPLKEYEIVYWEKLAQEIVIPAHSPEEAKAIFERDYLTLGLDSYEMEVIDSDWTIVNPD